MVFDGVVFAGVAEVAGVVPEVADEVAKDGETPGSGAALVVEGAVLEEVVAGRLAGEIAAGAAGLFFAVRAVPECPPM